MSTHRNLEFPLKLKNFPMLKVKELGKDRNNDLITRKYVEVEFSDYCEIGATISSMLELVNGYMDTNREIDKSSVSYVIDFVQKLIPFSELEFLSDLQDVIILNEVEETENTERNTRPLIININQ
ncbi:hypothetical protein CAPN002_07390 [Capnocytophaga stomatis]|uniref:hypothetical protein n=1 Tax=Capnocytophaga stomatis TaxID=1848904 RepID=UPI00194FE679|nr:hypothetical protein [Capnocytophaga stomatis]GIJ93521.1 hypothetical protein CAPN002_07390 [Capnocytophaga stomatis]